MMAPLVGLESNQVSKSMNKASCIEAYHLDKHRGVDTQVLRDCLLSLNWRETEFVPPILASGDLLVSVFSYPLITGHVLVN